MIRKLFFLGVACTLFLFTIWSFYNDALTYDPLAGFSAKKTKPSGAVGPQNVYKPAAGKEMYEKNLFSPARALVIPKPVVPASQMAVVEPPKRPELALKGIVLDNFGDYVAILEIDKARAVQMRKGDKNDSIEVADIMARTVVLKWNDELINLSLDKIKTIDNPRATK